ncbi:hypothetical protein TI39_contig1085g00004 [Zymoseptoria brevis]|uniref:superoxide dismutase n=1 Tax=Zymoseptoria brevis TaxID=1047168 RepID=A0A0F4GEH4_9PEZI|nr:hypothetical protein TI39_contig1085g00004 [Zymoseptoria brevis]
MDSSRGLGNCELEPEINRGSFLSRSSGHRRDQESDVWRLTPTCHVVECANQGEKLPAFGSTSGQGTSPATAPSNTFIDALPYCSLRIYDSQYSAFARHFHQRDHISPKDHTPDHVLAQWHHPSGSKARAPCYGVDCSARDRLGEDSNLDRDDDMELYQDGTLPSVAQSPRHLHSSLWTLIKDAYQSTLRGLVAEARGFDMLDDIRCAVRSYEGSPCDGAFAVLPEPSNNSDIPPAGKSRYDFWAWAEQRDDVEFITFDFKCLGLRSRPKREEYRYSDTQLRGYVPEVFLLAFEHPDLQDYIAVVPRGCKVRRITEHGGGMDILANKIPAWCQPFMVHRSHLNVAKSDNWSALQGMEATGTENPPIRPSPATKNPYIERSYTRLLEFWNDIVAAGCRVVWNDCAPLLFDYFLEIKGAGLFGVEQKVTVCSWKVFQIVTSRGGPLQFRRCWHVLFVQCSDGLICITRDAIKHQRDLASWFTPQFRRKHLFKDDAESTAVQQAIRHITDHAVAAKRAVDLAIPHCGRVKSLPIMLGYSYDALELHFDKGTMEIYYSKHHQTYVNNLNNLLKNYELSTADVNDIKNLKLNTILDGELEEAIKKDFGSVEDFKSQFKKAATTVFGSGWAWLVDQQGTLKTTTLLSPAAQHTSFTGHRTDARSNTFHRTVGAPPPRSLPPVALLTPASPTPPAATSALLTTSKSKNTLPPVIIVRNADGKDIKTRWSRSLVKT